MGCRFLLAIFLIILGVWIWASNYGIKVFSFYRDWPIILVLIGFFLLWRLKKRKRIKW